MSKKTRIYIVLVGVAFLVVALIFGLIYCAIEKIDILAFFGTKWAYIIYFLLAIYVIFAVIILVWDRNRKLWHKKTKTQIQY